jgi:GTP-binding protein
MSEHANEIRERLNFMDYVPIEFVSALKRQRIDRLLPTALEVAAERVFRVATGELNRLLRDAMAAFPAPSSKGKPLRFLFATQAEIAPPTFVLFVNDPELIHFSYERFLENRIREVHPFKGTPIRLQFRRRREGGDR